MAAKNSPMIVWLMRILVPSVATAILKTGSSVDAAGYFQVSPAAQTPLWNCTEVSPLSFDEMNALIPPSGTGIEFYPRAGSAWAEYTWENSGEFKINFDMLILAPTVDTERVVMCMTYGNLGDRFAELLKMIGRSWTMDFDGLAVCFTNMYGQRLIVMYWNGTMLTGRSVSYVFDDSAWHDVTVEVTPSGSGANVTLNVDNGGFYEAAQISHFSTSAADQEVAFASRYENEVPGYQTKFPYSSVSNISVCTPSPTPDAPPVENEGHEVPVPLPTDIPDAPPDAPPVEDDAPVPLPDGLPDAPPVEGFVPVPLPNGAPTPFPTSFPSAFLTPFPTAFPTPFPTASPTPSPTDPQGGLTLHPTSLPLDPVAGGSASAVGDPHLQNIHGERFDLMREGKHVLINIPRGISAQDVFLRVQADVRRLGRQCVDMYFQELNITGSWAEAKRYGGYHYSVTQNAGDTPQWLAIGKCELKVVHGRTALGLVYLNLHVKHLGHSGFAVGGLLGEDDHADVSQPPASCHRTISLVSLGRSGDAF